jgi:hypothetical protein
MSKSSKNQPYNEPKTIIQKLMDRKREELLEKITADISGNTVVDLSNNVQPVIEPLIENTIIATKTNELLLKQKLDLLQVGFANTVFFLRTWIFLSKIGFSKIHFFTKWM